MGANNHRVCPVGHSKGLENALRKLVHNPKRLLGKYVKKGMAVLDVGCGPGLYSIAMAEMVGDSGRVIAIDLQQGMLDILRNKIRGKDFEKRIILHKCAENSLGVKAKADFALAFYVVHELPSTEKFMKEISSLLKPGAKLFIIEPNKRVSEEEFQETIKTALNNSFKIVNKPKVFLSRAILLEKQEVPVV
jgi:ubiquinone/menaquinone biosynthesis C-methylase UbiE